MKRLFVGILIGFVLSFAASANADVIESAVGKLIQGEFPVKIGDKQLSNKAIVVDGTSYLPVREFGEAIGYDVKFDPDMGISMTKLSSTPVPLPVVEEVLPVRKDYDKLINGLESDIVVEDYKLRVLKDQGYDKSRIDAQQKIIDDLTTELEKLKTEKAENQQ